MAGAGETPASLKGGRFCKARTSCYPNLEYFYPYLEYSLSLVQDPGGPDRTVQAPARTDCSGRERGIHCIRNGDTRRR